MSNELFEVAGENFGELSLAELREDQSAHMISGGWICTLTADCNAGC